MVLVCKMPIMLNTIQIINFMIVWAIVVLILFCSSGIEHLVLVSLAFLQMCTSRHTSSANRPTLSAACRRDQPILPCNLPPKETSLQGPCYTLFLQRCGSLPLYRHFREVIFKEVMVWHAHQKTAPHCCKYTLTWTIKISPRRHIIDFAPDANVDLLSFDTIIF